MYSIHNESFLKLSLLCEGVRMKPGVLEAFDAHRGIKRTRAGLGSGLELKLASGAYVNAPVVEHFVAQSSMELTTEGGHLYVEQGSEKVEVKLAEKPAWYDQKCSTGKPMVQVGTLQGTYLGMYPTKVCEFWQGPEKENCKYCSVGLNLGRWDAPEKRLDEVLEVVHAAREQSGITYVDFNTGHYRDQSFLDVLLPIIKRVKKETGLLVGVQTPPHPDLDRYRELKDIGVNRVSFCFECYDPKAFYTMCPGKARFYGLDRYLQAIDFCASLGNAWDREPWVTNGEIIAGLEAPEHSIQAIERISMVGAIPTVCVFRPLEGTLLEKEMPPKVEDMIPVFRHLYEACMERGLPIGLAPNIHVSLVLTPEECHGFSHKKYRFQKGKNVVKKMVLRQRMGHLFRTSIPTPTWGTFYPQ